VNTVNTMNINWQSPSALEKALGERMRRILEGIPWLREIRLSDNPAPFDRAFDWMASFRVPQGPEVELWIDCRAEPRPAHFPYVSVDRAFEAETTKRVRIRVFGAPHLSPRMRELCEKHGWSWYDLAGNCHINVPGVIYLERTGNAPVHRKAKPKTNLGTPEAGRVIRVLLAPENATFSWTQRQMQQESFAGVSLGMVNKVVRFLREEAFVSESPAGGFVLSDPLKLLLAWRDAYRFDLHQRIPYFTLLKGDALREALATLHFQCGGHAVYAAFSAAEIQAPHVRQSKTWMYLAEEHLAKLEKLAEAKRVDTGNNLEVLIPRDHGVFAFPDDGLAGNPRMACTNVVQTYVDLWHSGGRGQEAAEAILEQRLKPVWKERGFAV
jgi:hypothetical protein